MPSAAEILRGVHAIANDAWMVAVSWHVIVGVALVALTVGAWRPKRRDAALALAVPLASVSIAAMWYGNPFNGAMFAVLAVVVVALGLRLTDDRVKPGPRWAIAAGIVSIAFGWVYPHFLDAPAYYYLFAGPVGLAPCPTLAVVVGLALLGGGLGSRAIALTLGVATFAYGLFGALYLGVLLDIGLVVASAAIVACAATVPSRRALRRSSATSR